jgi:hypothetical protein
LLELGLVPDEADALGEEDGSCNEKQDDDDDGGFAH